MKAPYLLVAFQFLFISVSCDSIEFIKDFLLHQKGPLQVNAVLCWPKAEKIKLLKSLYKHYLSVSIPNFHTEDLSRSFLGEHQLFLTDLSCPGIKPILIQAEAFDLFRYPFTWLALNTNQSSYDNLLADLIIPLDTAFFVTSNPDADLLTYDVKAIYKIIKKSTFISNDIAKWVKGIGFEYFNELVVPRDRSNLMGIMLNVSYVITHLDSLNHLRDYINPHIDAVTKMNYIFVQYLLEMMNARDFFKMQREWGFRNSSMLYYTGMIGDLQKGESEIGGTAAFLTKDRIPLIDYVASTAPIKIKFIFKAPPLSYVANIFVMPFDYLVWISCTAMVALTSLTLYIIIVWEWRKFRYLQNQNQDSEITRLSPSYFDALMVEIGGVCQQGYEDEPKSPAGRTALIFSLVAFMFLYTSYSANVVALLQTTSNNIKTLEDLLKSRIQLGVDDQPYNRQYFMTETEPLRKAIYQEKVAPRGQSPNFLATEKGISKVRNDFFAFNVELGSAYKIISETFMEHEKCGLIEIQYLQTSEPWLALKKKSSYLEIIKIGIKKIHESGIQNREVANFFHSKPDCSGKGNNFMSVGLTECYYGFMIFGTGTGCALAVLALEIMAKRYKFQK